MEVRDEQINRSFLRKAASRTGSPPQAHTQLPSPFHIYKKQIKGPQLKVALHKERIKKRNPLMAPDCCGLQQDREKQFRPFTFQRLCGPSSRFAPGSSKRDGACVAGMKADDFKGASVPPALCGSEGNHLRDHRGRFSSLTKHDLLLWMQSHQWP